MKANHLIILTTIISAIYFGLMKLLLDSPPNIIGLIDILFLSMMYIAFMGVIVVEAYNLITEEDKSGQP